MKKLIKLLSLLIVIACMCSCTTVEQGDTGLKIHTLASDKGSIEALTPGVYAYNIFTCDIVTYPSRVVNYPFTAGSDEGSEANEEFVVNTKDQMKVSFDAAIDCYVPTAAAPGIYRKYKMDFEQIVKTRYRNYMRDVFNAYAANLTYEELSLSLNKFRHQTDSAITCILKRDGVVVERVSFLSNLRPPEELHAAIIQKIKAAQITAQKQQEVLSAKMDSAKMVTVARGQALANELLAKKTSAVVVQLEWIKAWEKTGGKVPMYIGNGSSNMFMLPKP